MICLDQFSTAGFRSWSKTNTERETMQKRLLGLLTCLTSAFVNVKGCLKNDTKKACQSCGCLSPCSSPMQHKAFAYWLQTQLKVLQHVMGISDGDGVLQLQAGRHIWQTYIWNEAVTLSSITARLEKKQGQTRSKKILSHSMCSWQFLTLSCVFPTSHYLRSQNQARKTYKAGISDLSSLSLPTWRARNTKRRSAPPPVLSTSRLFDIRSPWLWVHLATSIYSALPHRGECKLHWC